MPGSIGGDKVRSVLEPFVWGIMFLKHAEQFLHGGLPSIPRTQCFCNLFTCSTRRAGLRPVIERC